jgi:hypothetical protein
MIWIILFLVFLALVGVPLFHSAWSLLLLILVLVLIATAV